MALSASIQPKSNYIRSSTAGTSKPYIPQYQTYQRPPSFGYDISVNQQTQQPELNHFNRPATSSYHEHFRLLTHDLNKSDESNNSTLLLTTKTEQYIPQVSRQSKLNFDYRSHQTNIERLQPVIREVKVVESLPTEIKVTVQRQPPQKQLKAKIIGGYVMNQMTSGYQFTIASHKSRQFSLQSDRSLFSEKSRTFAPAQVIIPQTPPIQEVVEMPILISKEESVNKQEESKIDEIPIKVEIVEKMIKEQPQAPQITQISQPNPKVLSLVEKLNQLVAIQRERALQNSSSVNMIRQQTQLGVKKLQKKFSNHSLHSQYQQNQQSSNSLKNQKKPKTTKIVPSQSAKQLGDQRSNSIFEQTMNNQKLIQLLSQNLMSNKHLPQSREISQSQKKSKISRNQDTISMLSKNQRFQSQKTIQTQRENIYSSHSQISKKSSDICSMSENEAKIRQKSSGYNSETTPVRNNSKTSLSSKKMSEKFNPKIRGKENIVIEASSSIFDQVNSDCSLKLQINDKIIDLRELIQGRKATISTPATRDLQDITNIEVALKSNKKKQQKSNKKSQRKSSIENKKSVVPPPISAKQASSVANKKQSAKKENEEKRHQSNKVFKLIISDI